jgi:cytochrome b pre-mRNA-processing protein 3
MILAGFRRRSQNHSVSALYGAVVAQARLLAFYTDFDVPDTVEGRFDLLVLHLVLLLRRLGQHTEQESELRRSFGQDLFDAFCRDLDANLREMGVGDLAVPKRMQRFAEAFYGRQAAYGEALSSAEPQAIENALARNIFAADAGGNAVRLADYVRAAVRDLEAQGDDALNRGEVVFPAPALARERA